jgi:hypothetical protein
MIDYHRHFSGSIPVKTVYTLFDGRVSIKTLKDRLTITEPVSFKEFLQKFHPFDYIEWSECNLKTAFRDAVNEVEKDSNLDGAQFICSVDKYSLKPQHVFDLFNDVVDESSKEIGLILGIKYEKCQEFIDHYDSYRDCFKHICGINFISREECLNKSLVAEIIKRVRLYNEHYSIDNHNPLSIGMHVGEVGDDQNVKLAILLGVDVISHGTNASDDTAKKALDQGILIDVSFVSNILTSVIRNPSEHAFFNYINNPGVRLVSDDPVTFNNSINREVQLYDDTVNTARFS